ncbi:hypothetical protein ACP8HI_18830 [Paenibacillus sp. FA6]|uniref:hypothetical protein n=1 Tax=Paenibacillus sp. FA6 TaxID=3413029 RepID=UPI003F65C1AA
MSRFNLFVTEEIPTAEIEEDRGSPKVLGKGISKVNGGMKIVKVPDPAGTEAGLHNTDFFYYDIISDHHYNMGDIVNFRDKQLVVSQKTVQLEEIQLVYSYRLSREKGIQRRIIHNERLSGVSLEGEVLDVQGEQVKLHLTIDKDQSKETAH